MIGKKPNGVRRMTKEERWLIVAATTAVLALAFLSLTTQCYGPLSTFFQTCVTLTFTFFLITVLIVVYVAYNHYQNNENHGLSVLFDERKYKDFCYVNKYYVESFFDPEEITFPEPRLISNGFAVDALPGITSKLEDAKDEFNEFLAINGSTLYIYEVQAPGDGFVYFRCRENFRNDKLN